MPAIPEPEGVPSGTIAVWMDTIATIPSGWNLCDGTNGTPDLRQKYPRCVPNDITNPGTTGGSGTIVLTESQLPFHDHNFSVPDHEHDSGDQAQAPSGSVGTVALTGSTFSGEFLADISSTATISGLTSSGNSSSHNNLPKTKDVLYIQKS